MHALQRIALTALIVAGTATAAPCLAQAQKFPSKPIRLVVAFTPGGTTDVLARMIGPAMNETWGQPLVIENRPGAGGTLAATIVAKAPPDGYTLLATSASLVINAALTGNAHYDPLKDFSTVGELGYATTVLVVSPSLGVKTLKEFIALANTKPIKLLFGSVGAGSSTHLGAERFRLAAGIKAQHVGFKGQSEFVIEIVTGRIHFGASGLVVCLPFIREGKLVPLVVATPQRSPLLPDVPSAPEVLPAWGREGSQAWLAPAGTPRAIRERISREMGRALQLPETRERLQNMGFNVVPTTPDEHEKNLRADIEIFTRLVKEAGLKSK